jgi:ABC-type sugar transport system permease subunit
MNDIKHANRLKSIERRQNRLTKKIEKIVATLKNEKKMRLKTSQQVYKMHRQVLSLNNKITLLEQSKITLDESLFKRIKIWFRNIPYQKQKVIWGLIFLSPWILGFIWFFAVPIFTTIWWSFNTVKLVKPGVIQLDFVGFKNYETAFKELTYSNKIFVRVLLESSWELILNIPVILIFSLIIAVLLNTKFKGNAIVKAIFFIPVIFNSAALKIAMSGGIGEQFDLATQTSFTLTTVFENFLMSMGIGSSIINFLLSILDRIFEIVRLSGVQILIFLSAIQSISKSLYEAAEIEGATKYEVFWKVTFPIVSPMFLTVIVYTIVDTYTSSKIVDMISTAQKAGKYGLASSVAVIYLLATITILLTIFLLIRKWVFSYDKK